MCSSLVRMFRTILTSVASARTKAVRKASMCSCCCLTTLARICSGSMAPPQTQLHARRTFRQNRAGPTTRMTKANGKITNRIRRITTHSRMRITILPSKFASVVSDSDQPSCP